MGSMLYLYLKTSLSGEQMHQQGLHTWTPRYSTLRKKRSQCKLHNILLWRFHCQLDVYKKKFCIILAYRNWSNASYVCMRALNYAELHACIYISAHMYAVIMSICGYTSRFYRYIHMYIIYFYRYKYA